MASNKLHPIYVALDSHQYSRAVKLASSLPQSNHLGQALLAHAHLKSGHAVKSLLVIQSVLWFQSEQLEYEIQRLGLGTGGAGEGAVESAPKKGKKGSKHKPETLPPAPAPAPVQRDLLEQLESPLILAKGWGQVKLDPQKPIITDETTLETLQITLQSMRLYATVFQMYASASSVAGATPQVLTKAYTSGLRLVPESLAEMQVFALQLARSRPETTLWAAQTALWQLEFNETELQDTKKQMLPRLAESLAAKYAQESAEASLLYISTLKYQKKWQQVVTVLADNQQLTTLQKGELEAHALEQLQQYELAQGVYEKLLVQNPQQWTYWKKILECAHFSGGTEGASIALESCLQKSPPPNCSRPCRSRHLIPCELACLKHRNDNETTTTTRMEGLSELQDTIVQYGSVFATRASCAYSDLAPYIEQLLVESPQEESSKSLLEWAASQLLLQHDQKGEMDRSQLRSYIFAIQVTYKILSILNHDTLNNKFLPDWMDLVNNWRASQKLGTSKEGEGVRVKNETYCRVQHMLCVCVFLFPSSII
jgi:tetratricopeptide (TPR) repeat protein